MPTLLPERIARPREQPASVLAMIAVALVIALLSCATIMAPSTVEAGPDMIIDAA